MDNPAQALIDLLDGWRGPGNHAPETYRGVTEANDLKLWQLQNKAVGLLIEIERVLDEMETLDPDDDLSTYRRQLLPVYQAVYGYAPVWRNAVGKDANPREILPDKTPLRLLVSLIRKHRRLIGVGGGDRDALRTALNQALEELDAADYLRPEVRAYLITVLRRALAYVDDASATDGQVRSAAHEAAGALVAAEATTDVPDKKKSVLKDLATKVATAVVVNIGTDGTQRVLTEGTKVVKGLLGELDNN